MAHLSLDGEPLIKPSIGKLLGLSNDKKLSRSTVFAAVYPDSDNEGTENYIEGTENYNEGTETTPENWTNPEVWTTEVIDKEVKELYNHINRSLTLSCPMTSGYGFPPSKTSRTNSWWNRDVSNAK